MLKRMVLLLLMLVFVASVCSANSNELELVDYLPPGYVTDGSVDYHAEIQQAIDDAKLYKRTLIIPGGLWNIGTQGLAVYAGTRIRGGGKGVTYIDYYGSGSAIKGVAPAWPNYYLELSGFTLRDMSSGAVGIEVQGISFITISDVLVTGISNVFWTDAGIKFDGSTYEMYETSLYDVDVDYANIGISFIGIANVNKIHGGRIRACRTGIKVDNCGFVKLFGVDFTGMRQDIFGSVDDGTAVEVNPGAVQSFGSRFEFMDTAYKNVGDTNTIHVSGDSISATSINHDFFDGTSRNIKGVSVYGLARHLLDESITKSLRVYGTNPSKLYLENKDYDNISLGSYWNYNLTLRLKNETTGVDYLAFDHNGTKFKIGNNSKSLSWGGGPPTGGRTYEIGDRVLNVNTVELGAEGSKYIIEGWVCVQGGTPGEWREQRTYTGN